MNQNQFSSYKYKFKHISKRIYPISAAIAEALDENLSPAEKRSIEAERRAAWRKARLKSLENVSRIRIDLCFNQIYLVIFGLVLTLYNIIFLCIGCHSGPNGDTKNVGTCHERFSD